MSASWSPTRWRMRASIRSWSFSWRSSSGDGPVTGPRRDELQALASRAGYRTDQLVFGTVYLDRSAGPLKRNLPALATGSFVWCAAEEDTLIVIGDETAATALLAGMLQQPCER